MYFTKNASPKPLDTETQLCRGKGPMMKRILGRVLFDLGPRSRSKVKSGCLRLYTFDRSLVIHKKRT